MKLTLENPNPTESEKKMFDYCGLYPVERRTLYGAEYIKYAEIHLSKQSDDYPTRVETLEQNINFDNTITFNGAAEGIKLHMQYADTKVILLILDRCKELGWS